MNKKDNKTVIVLGSPRGGTSLTSGILSDMGVDMGNIRKPDAQNPTGYFEDIDISRLCDRIIYAIGPQYNGFNLPDKESIRTVEGKSISQISTLLEKKSSNSGDIWGWKTITTSLLFDLFIKHIEHPYLIIVYRNPFDIAQSIMRYTDYKQIYEPLDLQKAMAVTLRYYSEINRILEEYGDIPVHFITYEGMIADPESAVLGVSGFLNIELDDKKFANALKRVKDPKSMNRLRSKNRMIDAIRSKAGSIKRKLGLQ